MTAERLREAARVLRERLDRLEPWEGDEDTRGWVDEYGGIGTSYDMQYIATVHPGVGLALADWLDAAGADEWAHGPHCLTPCIECDDDPRAPHVRAALAVADQILGGTQ